MHRKMSDDELLASATHDVEAFAVFYRRHAAAILGYLRFRTGNVESAADLTADVFVAAFRARRRYQGAREPARAWLFGIANNLVAMEHRRAHRAAAARARLGIGGIEFDDDELERAEEALSASFNADGLQALVADLPEEQRAAVLARVVDERPYTEIAREQGTSEEAVRQRVSRGLARLRLTVRREEL
jgi:RNA polymerase sigma factor (sigma-70 family)